MYSEVVTGSTDLKKLFYVHEQRTSPALPRYNRYFRGDGTCDTTSLTTVPHRILNAPYVKPVNYKRRFKNDTLDCIKRPENCRGYQSDRQSDLHSTHFVSNLEIVIDIEIRSISSS